MPEKVIIINSTIISWAALRVIFCFCLPCFVVVEKHNYNTTNTYIKVKYYWQTYTTESTIRPLLLSDCTMNIYKATVKCYITYRPTSLLIPMD